MSAAFPFSLVIIAFYTGWLVQPYIYTISSFVIGSTENESNTSVIISSMIMANLTNEILLCLLSIKIMTIEW